MKRHRISPADVTADDGLGAVVEDGGRHAAEVGKGADMTTPEGGEVLARHEAGERVARVGEGHVEAVDVLGAGQGLDHPFIAPIHLGLGSGQHLETAVKLGWSRADALPGLAHVELHPLVGALVAVVATQAVEDHGRLQLRLPFKHLVDHRGKGVDKAGLGLAHHSGRPGTCIGLQILLHGTPIVTGLAGDLRPTRTGSPKGAKST